MKRIISFVLFIVFSIVVNAQSTFQTYTRVFKGENKIKVEPDFNFYGQKLLTNKVGIWGFALVERGWAEAYGGLLYKPADWLELAAGAGIEQNPALYRLAASIWMGHENLAFFIATEKGDGADNWWYKTYVKYQLGAWKVGAMSWRYQTTGLYLEYSPREFFSLWINPGRDLEFKVNRLVCGIDFKL